eukprot:365089-Chlamydomonas_euryale.AAC.3
MHGWTTKCLRGHARRLTYLQHNARGAFRVVGCQELVLMKDRHVGAPAPSVAGEKAVRHRHDDLQCQTCQQQQSRRWQQWRAGTSGSDSLHLYDSR